jgi:hypothetical protein
MVNTMTDSTPTDWRALCVELIEKANEYDPLGQYRRDEVLDRARAALAQPEPQGPSNQELYDYWISTSPEFGCADPVGFARAVLTRWGRPAIEPVPQQEAE